MRPGLPPVCQPLEQVACGGVLGSSDVDELVVMLLASTSMAPTSLPDQTITKKIQNETLTQHRVNSARLCLVTATLGAEKCL